MHKALGLTVEFGGATAVAYLNQRKEHEIMVIGNTFSHDFFRLLFHVLRAMMEDKVGGG